MPLYEYQCDACGTRFEIIQKFSDGPATTCKACGAGPVHRLMSSPAIQFKGSGWYITDYAKKSGSDSGKSSAPATASTDAGGGKSDATKTETTPAPTAPSPSKD